MKAVQFKEYGDIDVLEVADVDQPTPGPDEVLVQVRAAGINPGEASIRKGLLHQMWPATFPSGQGSDLAGVVESVGADVTTFAPGDEVFGFTDGRASQAEYVAVPAAQLARRPDGVAWEVLGGLKVAGTTAYAAVRAVNVTAGDLVVVSGAAGGVGAITVQLAVHEGATVIGLASSSNHDWLRSRLVIPVDYHGDDLADRIPAAAGGTVDAFIDTFGGGYVELAIQLGVAPERIETIIDFEAAQRHGTTMVGGAEASNAEVLTALGQLIADGTVEVPIATTYPLEAVRDAYRDLEQRHTRGKIVLIPSPATDPGLRRPPGGRPPDRASPSFPS